MSYCVELTTRAMTLDFQLVLHPVDLRQLAEREAMRLRIKRVVGDTAMTNAPGAKVIGQPASAGDDIQRCKRTVVTWVREN